MNRSLSFLCIFLLSYLQSWTQKAELVLPIIHGSQIESMSFSLDGEYFVSSSQKAIKLWETTTGSLIRTIQDDPAEVAKRGTWAGGFSVVALSSDGTRIVSARHCGATYEYGPSFAASIELWNAKTGQKIKDIEAFKTPTCVEELWFSNNDEYLLASFASGTEQDYHPQEDRITRIWNINTGKIILERKGELGSLSIDAKQLIARKNNEIHVVDIASKHQETYTAIDFIDQARLSEDGKNLYAISKKQLLVWNTEEQRQTATYPLELKEESYNPAFFFSADAKILTLVDFTKSGLSVRQYNCATGAVMNDQLFQAANGWGMASPDAKNLVLTPYNDVGDANSRLQTFDLTTGQVGLEFGLEDLQKTKFMLADQTAVLGDIHYLSLFAPVTYRHYVFNPRTKTMIFGDVGSVFPGPLGRVYFDMTKYACLDFASRKELWKPGVPSDQAANAVFAEDGSLSILTKTGEMIVYDPSGKEIERFQQLPELAGELVYYRAGQKLYQVGQYDTKQVYDLKSKKLEPLTAGNGPPSATAFRESSIWGIESTDNVSIRLFRKSDSTTTVATVIAIGEQDWVVATPDGLFDASPGAMKSLHYAYELELIELDQLKERYYEPGLLEKILGLEQGELRDPSKYSAVKLYPSIHAKVANDALSVSLQARNGGIGKLSLFINGKEVQENINPNKNKEVKVDLRQYAKYYFPGQDNRLTLRSFNAEGWLKSPATELAYIPSFSSSRGSGSSSNSASSRTVKPSLYALIVGTADYSGSNLDLAYADKDAAAIFQALQSSGKALFNDRLDIQLLSTDKAAGGKISSKTNIKAALEAIAGKAKANDVLVVYFAGHGVTYGQAEKMQFYYLTKDIGSEDLSDPEIRNNFAISSAELTAWLTAIPAQKQVMMLDACNSGKVVESLVSKRALNSSQIRALDRMKDRTGMFVISGSAADKVSYEASQYGQGLLTYSLLQGMQMVSASNNNYVDVMQLFQYSRDRVPVLAKGIGGIQTPMLAFPNDGSSFDIGIVNESVNIPVARVKPVFIRNVFQDENAFDDVLGLGQKMSDHFKKISSRGANASYIYVDVSQFENAYSLKGRYTVNGEEVKVRGALFKGSKNVGPFEITGKKEHLDQLVEDILYEVEGMVE